MKFIVTAGGQGTKLWPLSRQDKPKQFQNIIENKSLYQHNIDILLKKYNPVDIFVSTKRKYLSTAKQQSPKIPNENYIVEPDISKNRGPAEGLAFVVLSIKHPDKPFIIIQSDVYRAPEDSYLNMIDGMEKLVKSDKKFITGGIKATHPTIGVDYLKLGNRVNGNKKLEVYKIDKFIERTNDYESTKRLVENFHITIHCTHSCWFPGLMLEAYKKYRPDWYGSLMDIKDKFEKHGFNADITKIFENMKSGSTEEVTENIFKEGYVVLVPYRWTDIGAWNSIYEYFAANGKNHIEGTAINIDTKSSLIKSTNKNKLIATVGVDNMVIVDTDDCLLIMPKQRSDSVTKILDQLKEKKLTDYL